MIPEMMEEDLDYDFDDMFLEDDDDDDFDDDIEDDIDDDAFDDDDGYEMMEDDDDDDIERRRRRRRRRRGRRKPRTARGKGYYSRQLKGYVKRTELRASLAKVGRDVQRNGKAIKSNASRISGNRSRLSSISRVNARQGSELKKLRRDLEQSQQMTLMMTLLESDRKTLRVLAESGTGVGRTMEVDEQGDQLTKLLPLLMMGSSGSGSGGMGMNNPMMMLLLAGGLK